MPIATRECMRRELRLASRIGVSPPGHVRATGRLTPTVRQVNSTGTAQRIDTHLEISVEIRCWFPVIRLSEVAAGAEAILDTLVSVVDQIG